MASKDDSSHLGMKRTFERGSRLAVAPIYRYDALSRHTNYRSIKCLSENAAKYGQVPGRISLFDSE